MVDLYFYRDPEAEENKEALDEAKVPGADEVGPAAIEQGFGGNADWEVSGAPAGAFAAASGTAATGGNWDAAGETTEWAAAPAAAASGQEWGAAPATEQW